MKNNQTNKPVRNFQKKKYYTNRNIQNKKVKERIEYYFNPLTKEWHRRIVK